MIKLVDILNEADMEKCPAATQSIKLNLQNRQKSSLMDLGLNE